MTALQREHLLRMERVVAGLRLAAVLLAGVEIVRESAPLVGHGLMVTLWSAALVYAAVGLLLKPYRRGSLTSWDVASGFVDWGFITLGIIVTGGERSELYLLYFLLVLSIAMRFGLREVLIAAIGTAIGYLGVVVATSSRWTSLEAAALHMGYLLLFAIGTGVLAREMTRQFRARVKEEAQRLAVQEMTATVSHDLKNPLTAVSGLVDVLLESAADNLTLDQRSLLHRIDANTLQMANLVGNLLDAELIESGHQPFRPAPVDLNGLVRRVVEAQAHQAEGKQIGLVLDLSPRLPAAVLDSHLIERLVANLLSNAVKFTPNSGAIRVSTRQHGSQVGIEVWDSGPDVPAAVEALLFEKFVRQDDSSGIGLGLYICKSIVDAHGGAIAVRKPPGGGIAFVADLPLAGPARAAPRSVDRPSRRLAGQPTWQPRQRAGAFVKG